MKNLESVDGVTEGQGEGDAVAEVESEEIDNNSDDDATNKKDSVTKKNMEKAVVFQPVDMVSSEGENNAGYSLSEESDATPKTGDLVSSENNGDSEKETDSGKNEGSLKTPKNINNEIDTDEKNKVSKINGNEHISDEETTVDSSVNDELPTVEPSSDFELSETDREESVPTQELVTPYNDITEEESQITSADDQDKSEFMEVAASPVDTSTETLPYAKETSTDSEANSNGEEESVSDEMETCQEKEGLDKEVEISEENTDKESCDDTNKEGEAKASSELSKTHSADSELLKEGENRGNTDQDTDSNSKESNTENSRDSCKILMCSFVDQSPAKETSKDEETTEALQPEPASKVNNTISLEPASTDDDSQSQESEEDLDINAGLEKCFSALEKKIDKEEDTSEDVDDPVVPEEEAEKKDEDETAESKEDSTGINIPIHDVDDDDDM